MAGKNDSFLPQDYIEKRIQRRTNFISLSLFVVVMGMVVGAFYYTDQQRSEVITLQRQVDKQFEEAARRLEQLDELQKRKALMIHKAKVTSALLERVPRTLVLAELINNMPPSLSLLELELTTNVIKSRPTQSTMLDKAKADARLKKAIDQNPAAEPIKRTEVTIQLVGVAPTDVQVAQFMTALGKADLFNSVNLAFSEEITVDKAQMRKFRIEMNLNQDIDTREYEPKMVKREIKTNPMSDKLEIGPDGKVRNGANVTVVPAADH
ncbi:MAG: hypothetical protein GC164_07580 [Phycisphaera sp.]|nr:hypothetical protein [Phycisphaera sp.]